MISLLMNERVVQRNYLQLYILYKINMNAPKVFDNQKGSYLYDRVCLMIFKG